MKISYQQTKIFSLFGKDFFKITTFYVEKNKENDDEDKGFIITKDYAKDEFDL